MLNVVVLWGDSRYPDKMTYLFRGQNCIGEMLDRPPPSKAEMIRQMIILEFFKAVAIPKFDRYGRVPASRRWDMVEVDTD